MNRLAVKSLCVVFSLFTALSSPIASPSQTKRANKRDKVATLAPSTKYLVRDALEKMRRALDEYDQSGDRLLTSRAVREASKAMQELEGKLPDKHPLRTALYETQFVLFDAVKVWNIDSGLSEDKGELERIKQLYDLETDSLIALRGLLIDLARSRHKETLLLALDLGIK